MTMSTSFRSTGLYFGYLSAQNGIVSADPATERMPARASGTELLFQITQTCQSSCGYRSNSKRRDVTRVLTAMYRRQLSRFGYDRDKPLIPFKPAYETPQNSKELRRMFAYVRRSPFLCNRAVSRSALRWLPAGSNGPRVLENSAASIFRFSGPRSSNERLHLGRRSPSGELISRNSGRDHRSKQRRSGHPTCLSTAWTSSCCQDGGGEDRPSWLPP